AVMTDALLETIRARGERRQDVPGKRVLGTWTIETVRAAPVGRRRSARPVVPEGGRRAPTQTRENDLLNFDTQRCNSPHAAEGMIVGGCRAAKINRTAKHQVPIPLNRHSAGDIHG